MKPLYLFAAIGITCLPSLRAEDAAKFTSEGKLEFPADYREWIFLSSGLGMNYSSARSETCPRASSSSVSAIRHRR